MLLAAWLCGRFMADSNSHSEAGSAEGRAPPYQQGLASPPQYMQHICLRPENQIIQNFFFVSGATAPQWAMASSFTRFLDHAQRRTTVGRTPLDE